MAEQKEKVIALDFDGVLHTYTSGWTGSEPKDPPVEGAVEMVRALIGRGFRVIVMSSRADHLDGRRGILTWLRKHDFPALDITSTKVHADLYVDDRGFRFKGDCNAVLDFVDRGMKPWNK